MDAFDMVKEFHKTFNCHISPSPTIDLPAELTWVRHKLLKEEVKELEDAVDDKDLVEIADALADILYIVCGTALTYGIDLKAVFAEVHRSNMTKLDENGNPIFREDGKVLKSPLYSAPNLYDILSEKK